MGHFTELMKILTIIGARPQFVKAAAVSRALKKKDNIEEIIVHTGQHFDKNMSDIFFEEMDIPHPNYHLNINSLSHGAMTGRMMEKIEEILLQEKPDYLMVYGDTNSTLAGALAAKKLHCKVIHIEAGLRSFNMEMPEEVNRILTDRISDILFCPTDTAIQNLEKEGFLGFANEFHQVGDVMEDAALYYSEAAALKSEVIQKHNLANETFILGTLHRAENTDDPIRIAALIIALNRLAQNNRVIMPLHPRTKACIEKQQLKLEFEIIDPVGYFDMIELLTNCSLVVTDSGGLQKEAYFFNKFCVTMRDQTEWVELVENGFNALVGADADKIVHEANTFIDRKFDKHIDLYGGGKAADRIAELLSNKLA
ncbi:MAG: UDP-GlcNAc3NAcA epimerase [Algoriphagus sp.]|jgi:UDP-GlcNAc3NAcA epimerase